SIVCARATNGIDPIIACIAEYSGVATSSVRDGTATTWTNFGSPILTNALTATNANDLLIFVAGGGAANVLSAPSAGWTIEKQQALSGTGIGIIDQSVSSTGMFSPQVSASGSGPWVGHPGRVQGSGGWLLHLHP
ncbi:MAG TPA: hypothetical protein VGP82_02790, partial [Ktedonobacterales bacterium]|nr:hypothetical protein [Ktedonobacterales bacterium]